MLQPGRGAILRCRPSVSDATDSSLLRCSSSTRHHGPTVNAQKRAPGGAGHSLTWLATRPAAPVSAVGPVINSCVQTRFGCRRFSRGGPPAPSPGGQVSGMVGVPSRRPPFGLPHGRPWAELGDVGRPVASRARPRPPARSALQQVDGMALSKHGARLPPGDTSGASAPERSGTP